MTIQNFQFSPSELGKILSFESPTSDRLTSRENSRLEFKESFHLGSADEYAKTIAAFANAQGGYVVFGVRDSPRQVVGLKTTNFESLDPARLTQALNDRFAPEIRWESHLSFVRDLKVGLIYVSEAAQKPVVSIRAGGCLQQGAIYYRYRGRSEVIRYPELRKLLDDEKSRERDLWMRQLRKISEAGVQDVAILNLKSGEVSGATGKFFVSEDLLTKLQFVREGHFVENDGAPALRLLGDIRGTEGPMIQTTVRVPTHIREPEIIAAFLKGETVLSPSEYLKAICFEQSWYLPAYFFIQQTTDSIEETVDLLRGLEVRGQTRDKLVERLLLPKERFSSGSMIGLGPAPVMRRALVERLKAKTLSADEIASQPMRFFEVLTLTNTAEFDRDYVFNLLIDHVLPTVSQASSLTRTLFRKALCHLDNTWYRPLTLK